MTDLIERQAVIDAVNEYFGRIGKLKKRGLNKGEKAINLDTVGVIESLPSAQPESSFVTWLLDEIWDEDMWELNWQAFPEVLCRKLTKLGYIKEKDGEYERFDKQTSGN